MAASETAGYPTGGVAIVDAGSRPLLYAAAVEQVNDAARGDVLARLGHQGHVPTWLLLADPVRVTLAAVAGQAAAEFPTADLLARYHTAATRWQLTPALLLTLLEAWLSDLAFAWHSAEPPGLAACRAVGLLDALAAQTMQVIPDDGGSLQP